jgi:hypothetical protein
MENFQDSWNDIYQTVSNTADGGNATSAQLANIFDNDVQTDTGGDSWFGGDYNSQTSTNYIDQSAFNTAYEGNATSAQAATISDNDVQHDHGYDYGYLAAY